MNDIISASRDDNNNEPIRLGNESAGNIISFQLAQDFYNEITGKSERLTEKINSPFILSLSDIENLDRRLIQSTEQYNIVSQNASISISYVGDSSERYSSIERLKLHIGHKGCAVEEINLVYNLLIVLPKTQRPQEYKISINLNSRVAKIEGMRKDFDSLLFDIPLFHFELIKTGEISIDFVDITVANAIMTTIKTWTEGLTTTKKSSTLKILRSMAQQAPKIIKYCFLAIATSYISNYSREILPPGVGLQETAEFILYCMLSVFIFYRIGLYIGEFTNRNFSQVYEISYINFTPADTNLIDKSKASIKKSIFYSAASLVLAVLIGIISSIAATQLLKHIDPNDQSKPTFTNKAQKF
ncbi:MAG: hypothetical protein Q8L15_01530 [Methylobacter sp.]|nr:hypothetical protein [Methylobacter sp.]